MTDVIERQQRDMIAGLCPTYNDPNVLKIPIRESKEELVNLNDVEKEFPIISSLPTPEIPFSSPDYNAGLECSTYLRKSLYERLKAMAHNIRLFYPSYSIKVFEGLRSKESQKNLFDVTVEELRREYQDMSEYELGKLANKTVSSPELYNPYATGACVSVRLFDEELNKFVDCGKFGNVFGPNDQAVTFASNLTEEQKHNRIILLTAASSAGLVNYPYAWWQFSFGDRYFSFYTNNRFAVHGEL